MPITGDSRNMRRFVTHCELHHLQVEPLVMEWRDTGGVATM